ncbi:NUDIX hydrolase [Nitratireductor sp. XY-223]|uniref:NUDIX hydrolase n=1 Tax=Nitratireductor sp. XY-223 TaxID=2561926 RepID=UPI001FEE23F7|nr:NUDIX hydrolase [Nitratireductor sp. XY-223]
MSAILERWNSAAEYFSLMVSRPTPLQYAALCYRKSGNCAEVLLITSRGSGRWILPKGWAMKNTSDFGTAASEAFEEAGVVGRIGPSALGTYQFRKWMRGGLPVRCTVQVYPLEVERLEDDYPEKDERQRQWFSVEEAAGKVDEPELQSLIRDFCP